jgi:hypothetical protein
MHGLIYRWRATRLSDERVERATARVTLPAYEAVERLFAHRRRGAG